MARSLSAAFRPLLLGILGVGLSAVAAAVSLDVGDIVVVEPGSDRLVKVDPVTGSQTVVSSGGFFVLPQRLAIDATGLIIVADLAHEDAR